MRPEVFFKNEGLVALTSDSSIDFTPDNFDNPLTDQQRQYLKDACNQDIPQVFWRKQIHGDDIVVIDQKNVIPAKDGIFNKEFYKNCPDADAYITHETNLPMAIRTADCVPVFLFDPIHRVIGLAHAGWKGTYKGIAAKTVQEMHKKFNSQPSQLKAVLGPSIRQCCYQVGVEFKGYFPAHVADREGHLYANVVGANEDQLLTAGVLRENIFDSKQCTCCNKNYFSFRRDGAKAGRMISLLMLI